MRREAKRDPKRRVIGREAFAKISAVDGVFLSEEARRMFAEFDRLGLSDAERRRAIVARLKGEGEEQA